MKSTKSEIIQGDVTASIIKTAITFGTNVRVCSCICVTAWNKLMVNPTNSPIPTVGIDRRRVRVIPWYITWTTKSWFTIISNYSNMGSLIFQPWDH